MQKSFRSIWIYVLFLLPAFLNIPVYAQDAVALSSMEERLGKTAKISGGVIKGLSTYGDPARTTPVLQAHLSKSWSRKKICVQLVSVDGLYEGVQTFRIADHWQGGVLPIPFTTKYKRYLSNTNISNLATRISEGTCQQETLTIAPAFWNTFADTSSTKFVMHINSYRADEVSLLVNSKLEFACKSVVGSQRLGFDHECQIPINELSGASTMEIEVLRIKRGRSLDPEFARVVIK